MSRQKPAHISYQTCGVSAHAPGMTILGCIGFDIWIHQQTLEYLRCEYISIIYVLTWRDFALYAIGGGCGIWYIVLLLSMVGVVTVWGFHGMIIVSKNNIGFTVYIKR